VRSRIKDAAQRRRILRAMRATGKDWENFFLLAGPEKILLVGFGNEAWGSPFSPRMRAMIRFMLPCPISQMG